MPLISKGNILGLGPDTVDAAQLVDGWNDLTSILSAGKVTAGAAPSWAAWAGTNIYTWQFSASTQDALNIAPFHFEHDYKKGSAVYPHVHWLPDTNAAGVVRWGLEWSIAKGHQQEAFNPIAVTTYIEQATEEIQYMHMVSEVPDPGITIPGLEPDTLVMARLFRDATHINDTYPGIVHGLTVDVHHQVDRLATISRLPDFYIP